VTDQPSTICACICCPEITTETGGVENQGLEKWCGVKGWLLSIYINISSV